MKMFGLAGALLLAVICYQPSPASAQGIYVGPGGVGVDIGPPRGGYRDRSYDRPPVYREPREYRPRYYEERRRRDWNEPRRYRNYDRY